MLFIAGLIAFIFYTLDGPETTSSELGEYEIAIFAGGCFWCMEPPYDELDGIITTIAGYTGGNLRNPSYGEVSAGNSGHTEAIKIRYNPKKITYQKLLEVFWVNIDPTAVNRQFCDNGSQYRTAIFYQNDIQKKLAKASKQSLINSGRFKHIATEIHPISIFYPAEEYHQDYYRKNPLQYKFYRYNCGRDRRLKELWNNH